MTTFFLSYARKDQATALRFADALLGAGVSLWVDQYDIRPSEHWDRAVEAAVRSCAGIIVILSPSSVDSANVADEVAVAIDSGKRVIPILIDPCVIPLRMTRMQFIDATQDFDDALRRCVGAITHGELETAPPLAAGTSLPVELLHEVETRLLELIGPIAPVLLRKAAAQASSRAALFAQLARSLPDGVQKTRFLAWAGGAGAASATTAAAPPPDEDTADPEAGAGELTDETLAAISEALVRHLGPVAAQLVARERLDAATREDLCLRLARRIPGEKDRQAFLRQINPR